MSFDKQVSEVFDIDLWELKQEFQPVKQTNQVAKEEAIIEPDQEEIFFSNDSASKKIVNIFISNKASLDLFIGISNKLFFKSKVNIRKYAENLALDNNLNFVENDLIINSTNIYSSENKKNILTKLYEYSDFCS